MTPPSTLRLVLIPSLLTLAVTLLRLLAELQGWSPLLANRQGGGPWSLIGITWLIFVFGTWFGWQLCAQGLGPRHPKRTLLGYLLTTGGIGVALFGLVMTFGGLETAFPAIFPVAFAISIGGCAWTMRLWPELARVNLIYATAARLPVVIVSIIAVLSEWGTHYEKIGPGEGVELPPELLLAWVTLNQVFLWIPFTVLGGGIAGSAAAVVASQRRR